MSITRSRIEQLRTAIQLGVIPYSQSTLSPVTRRRADCSGLVSYVWDLPKVGPGIWLAAYSTETMWYQGVIFEVDRDDLRPGDAIGYCGPGTSSGGGGHIALWRGRTGDRHHIWDHGSGMGPKDRWVTWNANSTGWLTPGRCKAWRFFGVVEDDGTTYDGSLPGQNGAIMFCDFGDGGPVVRYLQLRMLDVDPNCLPRFGADSGYGNETAAALSKLVGGDGKVYGPDQMAALDKLWAPKFGDGTGGGLTEAQVAVIAEDVAEAEIAAATVTVTADITPGA